MPTTNALRVSVQDVKDVLRAPPHVAGLVVLMRGQDSPLNKCLDVTVLVIRSTQDLAELCCSDNGLSQQAVGEPASADIATQTGQSFIPSLADRSQVLHKGPSVGDTEERRPSHTRDDRLDVAGPVGPSRAPAAASSRLGRAVICSSVAPISSATSWSPMASISAVFMRARRSTNVGACSSGAGWGSVVAGDATSGLQ